VQLQWKQLLELLRLAALMASFQRTWIFQQPSSFYWIPSLWATLHPLCWIQKEQMLWLEEVHEENNLTISLMVFYFLEPDTFIAASAHLASSSAYQAELDCLVDFDATYKKSCMNAPVVNGE
jgi:hypothetical protein